MSKITVYGFLMMDFQQGVYLGARGKATRETIMALGGEVVESTAEVIDESQLNATGRYHDPSNSPEET